MGLLEGGRSNTDTGGKRTVGEVCGVGDTTELFAEGSWVI